VIATLILLYFDYFLDSPDGGLPVQFERILRIMELRHFFVYLIYTRQLDGN